jgi:hypothetical protein
MIIDYLGVDKLFDLLVFQSLEGKNYNRIRLLTLHKAPSAWIIDRVEGNAGKTVQRLILK